MPPIDRTRAVDLAGLSVTVVILLRGAIREISKVESNGTDYVSSTSELVSVGVYRPISRICTIVGFPRVRTLADNSNYDDDSPVRRAA